MWFILAGLAGRHGGLRVLAMASLLIAATGRNAAAQNTYTWAVNGSGAWVLAANWSPARTAPAPSDILVIDGTSTPSVTLHSVVSQQIGKLVVTNGASVRLQAMPPNPATLLITGGSGPDLDVQSGSLTLQSSPAITIQLNPGTTGHFAGGLTVRDSAHRLLSFGAGALVFGAGSVVTTATGFTGNLFGTSFPNGVLFESESVYVSGAGNDPIWFPSPNSIANFAAGSLYKHQQAAPPVLTGRTYGDFELNFLGHNTTTGGSAPLTVDAFKVLAGTLHLRTTEIHIRGRIYVGAGSVLAFDPTVTSAIHLDGAVEQAVTNDGTLTFNANANVTVSNAAGVELQSPVTLAGTTTVSSGAVLKVWAALMNAGTLQVDGMFQIESGGTAGGAPFVYGPVSTLVFNNAGPHTYLGEGYWMSPTPPPNVTLQGGGGVLLQAPSPAITGTLTLTDGILTGGVPPVVIAPGGTVAGGNATSFVNGVLVKTVPASGSPQTINMEIGGGEVYAPVSLMFPSVTVGGMLQCFTSGGDHVNIAISGIDPAQSVNRHWGISSGSMEFAPCTATFTFNPLDVDAGADPATFIVRKFDAPNVWTAPGTGTRTATSTEATGIASFSEFQIGEPVPPLFTGQSAGLPDVSVSATAWGDYDGDGDQDLVLTGHDGTGGLARIYRNDGASFTDIAAGLPGVWAGSVAWGDYDNDGDLDLVMTGTTGGVNLSRIYRNDAGTFVDIAAGLLGAYTSSSTWGDYDNDGDLDLLLTGNGPFNRFSRIYRNDAGSFGMQALGLANLDYSAAAWADYDVDGDLDILLSGYTGGPGATAIYRNDGGAFVDIGAGLPNLFDGAVAWADYDSDGDPDILLTGYNGSAGVSVVYRNDAGTFVDIGAGLHAVSGGDAAWGDYDNDGDPDIALTGRDPSVGNLTRIYRNDAGSFVDIAAGLTGVTASTVAWGDYDNDGDLDLVVSGNIGPGSITTRVYTNHTAVPNTVPQAPTGLSAQYVASVVTFSWNASTDAETPAAGLTYNLRVGTTPGGSEIMAPMANAPDGYRRVAALGNTNHRRTWSIQIPQGGPVYWSVQAVDAAFAGSAWASGGEVTAAPVEPSLPVNVLFTGGRPNSFRASTSFEFALPAAALVKLTVFDVQGRVVRVLTNGMEAAGRRFVMWDGLDNHGMRTGSGVYMARLEIAGRRYSHRIVRTQ